MWDDDNDDVHVCTQLERKLHLNLNIIKSVHICVSVACVCLCVCIRIDTHIARDFHHVNKCDAIVCFGCKIQHNFQENLVDDVMMTLLIQVLVRILVGDQNRFFSKDN